MSGPIMKFFDVQMGLDVCPPAKEKLFKRILPKLCVDNNICPLCSGELRISNIQGQTFTNSYKRCKSCKALFKGDKSYGRPNNKSTPIVQY